MRSLTIALLFLMFCGVRLTAAGSCRITNTQAIFFQNYSSATAQTTGQVQFRCDKGTSYAIGLSSGLNSSIVTSRLLRRNSDGATLGYQLFSNASYTINWGNDAGSNWVTGTGTGDDQSATIYAQIPGAQAFYTNTNGNNFSDMVTATLSGNFTTDTRTVQVTLQQVSQGCGIGANSLNFGMYSGTVLNATTTIQVACTSGTAYNVGLSVGTASGATVTKRSMTLSGGTALLGYALYSNAGYSTNWGYTIGSDTVTGTGNNGIQNLTVYGRIPAGQSVAVGNYADTIIATLTY
jgi:spore coat protein U-like protein